MMTRYFAGRYSWAIVLGVIDVVVGLVLILSGKTSKMGLLGLVALTAGIWCSTQIWKMRAEYLRLRNAQVRVRNAFIGAVLTAGCDGPPVLEEMDRSLIEDLVRIIPPPKLLPAPGMSLADRLDAIQHRTVVARANGNRLTRRAARRKMLELEAGR